MLPLNQLKQLLEKINAGTATSEEMNRVNDWYHSFDDSTVEVDTTSQDDNEAMIAAKIKQLLDKTIQLEKPVQKRIRRFRWGLPAAAAIILLIIMVGLYWHSMKEVNNSKKKGVLLPISSVNLLKPGGNKAILTLSNNTQVVLDSASNGLISTQGSSKVEKLANGQLVYTINGQQVAENSASFFNTITTPRGGQYQVTLADGTAVWLNAQSSIRFPVLFTGSDRQVEITGEVYFEVAKDPTKPFKVKTATSSVEVIGTDFNVNAYEDEEAVRTTLVEGKVKVFNNNTKNNALLLPGQQSSVYQNGRIDIDQHADTEEALAWKNGRFEFKSTDLKTILRQLQRWYDADVNFQGNVENLRFSGQLTRTDDVASLFKKIELTGEVHFKVEGKKIIVSH